MHKLVQLKSPASFRPLPAPALIRLPKLAMVLCGLQLLAAQTPAPNAPSAATHKPTRTAKPSAATPKQNLALPATPPQSIPQTPPTITIHDPAEFRAYQMAIAQAIPKNKAVALESFLQTYPQSLVKKAVLDLLIDTYVGLQDQDSTLGAANRALEVNPDNLRAIFYSVYVQKSKCGKTGGIKACDDAAALAQKGLSAARLADIPDDDWKKLTAVAYPVFHSAIAKDDAVSKKDFQAAETEYAAALALYTDDQSKSQGLGDTLQLAQMYVQPGAGDLTKAVWFYARVWNYAPQPYKSKIEVSLEYYYKKYYDDLKGLEDLKTQAAAAKFPPEMLAAMPGATPPVPELPKWPVNEKADQASVVWDSRGLRIDATNSSLQQILDDVSAATGAKVEGMASDERVFGSYGPGQARDVLTQLLVGSGYNFLMIGDQGQGTPRQIVLTVRAAAGTQPATRNSPTPAEEEEADEQPQQPTPEPPPNRPPFQPRTPQAEMQQREMRMQQQQQQQQQGQQPNQPQGQQPGPPN